MGVFGMILSFKKKFKTWMYNSFAKYWVRDSWLDCLVWTDGQSRWQQFAIILQENYIRTLRNCNTKLHCAPTDQETCEDYVDYAKCQQNTLKFGVLFGL